MFTRLLYLNKERIVEYNSLLSNEDYAELDEIEVTSQSNLGANMKVVNGEKGIRTNYKGKVYASVTRLWNTFYGNLRGNDYYIDFLEGDEKSIEALGRGTIIRFETEIEIPEAFDTISILNIFPENFIKEQITSEIDENEKDLVRNFFRMKKASLPICMNLEDMLLCSKLYSNCFQCDDEEFEECLDEELVVVAKVISNNKSRNKEIFNPLKDFFVINRAARRTMNIEKTEGLENIYAEKNYVDLEVLAIYQ